MFMKWTKEEKKYRDEMLNKLLKDKPLIMQSVGEKFYKTNIDKAKKVLIEEKSDHPDVKFTDMAGITAAIFCTKNKTKSAYIASAILIIAAIELENEMN